MSDDLLNFGGGLFGFLLLILDIILITEVINSNRSISQKLALSALIFCFPLLGALIYLAFCDRYDRTTYTAIV